MSPVDPDLELRQLAVQAARALAHRYTDLVPLAALRAGFEVRGRRVSFGSFQKGIHRARQQRGPAALTLMTSLKDPYGDDILSDDRVIRYGYREGPLDGPDNRALRAAVAVRAPLVYFRAIAPGLYATFAPMFATADDPASRSVVLEAGLPLQDTGPDGLVSGSDLRAYATREIKLRLHQQRFRVEVLAAYRGRCTVCALRETSLVQAAHIIGDREEGGVATVVNGLALCAIHHLAFDRNLLGIDPHGVVHIAERLLREIDGPMLRTGLQGFHGARIEQPRRPEQRPDRLRLAERFTRFEQGAA